MKGKIKNIFRILILTIILLFMIFNSTSQATDKSEKTFWSELFEHGDNFLEKGKNSSQDSNSSNDGAVKNIVNDIYNILFPLGVVVTVIIGGVLGIKFMLASAEEKAKIKESMVPYIVGCIVIYGAFGIWKICIQLFSGLS